jgi:hypothetical protein
MLRSRLIIIIIMMMIIIIIIILYVNIMEGRMFGE